MIFRCHFFVTGSSSFAGTAVFLALGVKSLSLTGRVMRQAWRAAGVSVASCLFGRFAWLSEWFGAKLDGVLLLELLDEGVGTQGTILACSVAWRGAAPSRRVRVVRLVCQ
jgi:hypothetical protein